MKKLYSIALLLCVFLLIIFIYNQLQNENNMNSFKSSDGVEGEYRIYPVDEPAGTLLWLHGDGAYEYNHPHSKEYLAGPKGIKHAAKDKRLTLVVPKTPNDDTWWKQGEQNAAYLVELISSLPDHETLWIGGFSGGSELTTYWLLEDLKKAGVKQGGAVLFGGGGSPEVEGITSDREKRDIIEQPFPLTWIVGATDDGLEANSDGFNALKASREGEAFYRSQNWDTNRQVITGYGHLLSKDGEGLYGHYLSEMIDVGSQVK